MRARASTASAMVAILLVSACSGDDAADGCDSFREELATIEETFETREAQGWDDVVELQEFTLRREALRSAIAAGSC